MRVWRLVREPYASLDGEGARRFGGRWNSPGYPVVYTAADAALTVLEVRVHLDLPLDLLPDDYRLLGIEIGDRKPETGPLLSDPVQCRSFGDRWLHEARSAVLMVPSVIVPESFNVLINPQHPDAHSIRIVSRRAWTFDPRLF